MKIKKHIDLYDDLTLVKLLEQEITNKNFRLIEEIIKVLHKRQNKKGKKNY